jgi:hypothetical protein
MEFTEEYKKSLELRMVGSIIAGLEQGQLEVNELHVLADAILKEIDTIKTHDALIVFLEDIARRWPIFQTVLESERLHLHVNTV